MIYFLCLFIMNIMFFLAISFCYEVPNVKLKLLHKGFSLTIPDEPGIKQVIYIIKYNNECPTLMDTLFEPQIAWTSIQTWRHLNTKDKLNVSILVNHQGEEVYKSHQYFIVGENELGMKVMPPTVKPSTNCGAAMVGKKCEKSQTVVSGMTHICRGQLLFEDNFNNGQLNTNKWSYDIRNFLIGTESEEFVLFDNHTDNIFMHDGYLNIRPTLTRENMRQAKLDFGSRCTPIFNRKQECKLMPRSPFIFVPPFNSSQVHTAHTFLFKYARIEIKAKLPKGAWILPYLMLQSHGVYDEKQIRIAFARGNEELLTCDNVDLSGKVLYAGIVSNGDNHKTHFQQKSSNEHYGNHFHIYTLKWKATEISMEIDGIEFGTITEHLNEIDRFFFITLGVSVGGHLQFPDNLLRPNNKPWSNTSPRSIQNFWNYINSGQMLWTGNETLIIDYVKVYAI